jgi:hypothetical protein
MTQINELMEKEMSRKEFLATLGFGIASAMGLSAILKFLLGKKDTPQNASLGYGSSSYGGAKRS